MMKSSETKARKAKPDGRRAISCTRAGNMCSGCGLRHGCGAEVLAWLHLTHCFVHAMVLLPSLSSWPRPGFKPTGTACLTAVAGANANSDCGVGSCEPSSIDLCGQSVNTTLKKPLPPRSNPLCNLLGSEVGGEQFSRTQNISDNVNLRF